MTPDEIVEAAVVAVETYGFQALVLQSGEDPGYTVNELSDIIMTLCCMANSQKINLDKAWKRTKDKLHGRDTFRYKKK